jgi:hypothetical protein
MIYLKKEERMNKKTILFIAVIVLLLIVIACGGSSSDSDLVIEEKNGDSSDVASSETKGESIPVEPEPTEDPNTVKPGTYLVGTDIQPGIYYGITGTGTFDSCYWERKSDLSGELDSIIANENAIGQYYLEVIDSDYALETACEIKMFGDIDTTPSEYPTVLEPGIYLIGEDIAPGMYRGEAGEDILESCYWARLKDVKFELESIISNDNAMGQFYLEVNEGDFALKTGCELEFIE